MNITLKQLEIFRAVAQFQNLGQAAETMFVTKGAVSQSLQELERQLGVQLFDRVHPRLYLNHEGRRLLPLADELLQRTQDIGLILSKEPNDRFLSMGCSKTIGTYVMPKLIKRFESACAWLPDVQLANTQEICQQVAAFMLDIALLEGDERHPDLVFEPWIADEMVVIAGWDHPLQAGVPYPLAAIAGEHWVLREISSGSREYFDGHLAPLLPSYTIAMTLSSLGAIAGAVAEGIGVTFASRMMAEQALPSHRLKIIDLEQVFSRRFSIAYHRKKYHSVSMQQFLEYCRNWQDS